MLPLGRVLRILLCPGESVLTPGLLPLSVSCKKTKQNKTVDLFLHVCVRFSGCMCGSALSCTLLLSDCLQVFHFVDVSALCDSFRPLSLTLTAVIGVPSVAISSVCSSCCCASEQMLGPGLLVTVSVGTSGFIPAVQCFSRWSRCV